MSNNNDLYLLLGPNYVPEGYHNVFLRDMSLNPTKDNDHYYIIADFEVADGDWAGRIIKQVWTFRQEQESRTNDRINNFLSKVDTNKLTFSNNTIVSLFNVIREKLENVKFAAWLVKNIDSRSEMLYALERIN